MIPIEDKVFENETVIVDGKFFLRCTIKHCTLIYMGGDYAWDQCDLSVNVWSFKGPAWRTIEFLKSAGIPLEGCIRKGPEEL